MMETAAKRRKVYKETFCKHPDNQGAIKMADLLYGDYYPKRNKDKAFLDALEDVGGFGRESIARRIGMGVINLTVSTAFNWAASNQGRAYWLFLQYRDEELGKPHYI